MENGQPDRGPESGRDVRWALVLVILLLPGCFTELLVASDVTARNIACHVVQGERTTIVHHGQVHPEATAITRTWAEAMPIDTARVSVEFDDLPPLAGEDWEDWLAQRGILDDGVTIHVLWLDEVPIGQTHAIMAPGVLAMNRTAAVDTNTTQGIFLHGMGHLLGAVNMGIPMQDRNLTRETSTGHEPGVMAEPWHRLDDIPHTVTDRYSDEAVRDWSAAAADPRVCP